MCNPAGLPALPANEQALQLGLSSLLARRRAGQFDPLGVHRIGLGTPFVKAGQRKRRAGAGHRCVALQLPLQLLGDLLFDPARTEAYLSCPTVAARKQDALLLEGKLHAASLRSAHERSVSASGYAAKQAANSTSSADDS